MLTLLKLFFNLCCNSVLLFVFKAILTVAKEVKSIIKIQAAVRGYLGAN